MTFAVMQLGELKVPEHYQCILDISTLRDLENV